MTILVNDSSDAMKIDISEIKRSRRRSIAVEVHDDTSVIVRAPRWVSMKFINKFIDEKRGWILKKQNEAKGKMRNNPPREFAAGEEFFYLGEPYKLKLADKQEEPLTFDGAFVMSERHRSRGRKVFTDWYRREAKRIIPGRARIISAMSGLKYKKMSITSAKSRWVSCSESGNINFSLFLVMAPLRVIDYVVTHEISHISELNHSKNFWGRVESLIPDFREQQRWLKQHEHLIVL